jgi:hypothetical protein
MSNPRRELAALAAHLRSRREAILEAWRQAVTHDPKLATSAKLPRAQLNDHIPVLLETFERRLDPQLQREDEQAPGVRLVLMVEAMAGIMGPVVVVDHSAGGAPISLVPERTRVDRLVYVTAVVPQPGRSIVDVIGGDVRETILSVSRDDGNGCRSFNLDLLASLVPPEERDAYLAFLRATQRPQGWAALEQTWPGRSLPDVPRTYILCTEDQTIPPARQREMAARLGVSAIEIASDHSVFALRPRELAAVLAE